MQNPWHSVINLDIEIVSNFIVDDFFEFLRQNDAQNDVNFSKCTATISFDTFNIFVISRVIDLLD